jgi:hypothetical protein
MVPVHTAACAIALPSQPFPPMVPIRASMVMRAYLSGLLLGEVDAAGRQRLR